MNTGNPIFKIHKIQHFVTICEKSLLEISSFYEQNHFITKAFEKKKTQKNPKKNNNNKQKQQQKKKQKQKKNNNKKTTKNNNNNNNNRLMQKLTLFMLDSGRFGSKCLNLPPPLNANSC